MAERTQLIEVVRRNPHTSFIPIVALAGAVEDLRGIPLLIRPVDARSSCSRWWIGSCLTRSTTTGR